MKYLFLLLASLSFSWGFSQKGPYKFSHDILSTIDEQPNSLTLQIAATDFSFQGNYKQALRAWNLQLPHQKAAVINNFDSLYLTMSKLVAAKEYIIERSKNEKLLILNELHHNASHRIFATSLLKGLYDTGYRYLGLEALSDSGINARGFAVQDSGYYTSEPQFGNFIKEALDLGFVLFGYEANEDATWDGDKWKNREIDQAHNIYRFMETNKDGKYFIYCGAGHAFEGDNNGKGLSMAGVLAELTHINP